MADNEKDDWMWFAGASDELYTVGPCHTKEEAIEEMINDGAGEISDNSEFAHIFQVAEATNPPIMLRDWIGADNALERADESIYDNDRVSSEYDDTIFDVTPEQDADLQLRIKKACDEWQETHGLKFKTSTFEKMRSHEEINIPKTATHAPA